MMMMTSYFNLLKYAATGIASPDMTYFDKLRASTLMGGAVQTLTGIPPLSFKADGTPLISWSMKGNGQQSGTPTPDNPVMPDFVGVRTGNLLAANGTVTINNVSVTVTNGHFLIVGTTNSEISSNNTAWKALDFTLPAGTYRFKTDALNGVVFYIKNYETSAQLATRDSSFTLEAETRCYIAFYIYKNNSGEERDIMINTGSTALPYEPYGWKIPLTNAGQTTPVYLGQTQTVRRIRKLVLTEESDVDNMFVYNGLIYVQNSEILAKTIAPFCNCLIGTALPIASAPMNCVKQGPISGQTLPAALYFKLDGITTKTGFLNFLSTMNSAGHPVTVWYVLETEQTGIVNEPLCKIGDYADELHSEDAAVTLTTAKGQNTLTVDTELQPSEMTITFKG